MPKVVVATQTRVIEAAVDEEGEWLPAVPVISIVADAAMLWPLATALCSPPADRVGGDAASRRGSLVVGHQAERERCRARCRCPSRRSRGSKPRRRLRAGDVLESGRLMCTAYGVDDTAFTWWRDRLPRRR